MFNILLKSRIIKRLRGLNFCNMNPKNIDRLTKLVTLTVIISLVIGLVSLF